jgi:hypothetical protein
MKILVDTGDSFKEKINMESLVSDLDDNSSFMVRANLSVRPAVLQLVNVINPKPSFYIMRLKNENI